MTITEIIGQFGQSCKLPGSFFGAMAVVQLSPDYVSAVRNNIMAGGDSCGRAGFIGALWSAKNGLDGIPRDWIEKVTDIEETIENAITIA